MKKRTTLLTLTALLVLFSTVAFSQMTNNIPNLLHFTAVARDISAVGTPPYANQSINVRLEVFQGSVANDNSRIFCQSTPDSTNAFGEFSIDFPSTHPNSGYCFSSPNLSAIDWSTGDKYVRVSFQPPGGASNPYTIIAFFPFTTVPFAFASRTAESLTNFDLTGATNGKVIKYNATTQKWEAGNDETFVTGNDTYTQAPVTGDGSQGNPVTIGQNGATSGQVLKWNGASWAPANDNGSYSAGSGIEINGSNVISAADISNTNEIQTLDFNATTNQLTITGSGGNTVQLNGSNTNVDIVGTNGIDVTEAATNNFTITTDAIRPTTQAGTAGGDITGTYQNLQIGFASVGSDEIGNNAVGNNEMADNAVGSNEIINSSIAAIDLDDMGALQGQVLTYDNNQWKPANLITSQIAVIQQRYATANGGSAIEGFNNRDLTHCSGCDSSISLDAANDFFTLQPGKYLIRASAPAYKVGRHQAIIRVAISGNGQLFGTNAYSNVTNPSSQTDSTIDGILELTSAESYRLTTWVETTNAGTDALGIALNGNPTGGGNYYSRIVIQKIQ